MSELEKEDLFLTFIKSKVSPDGSLYLDKKETRASLMWIEAAIEVFKSIEEYRAGLKHNMGTNERFN